MAKLVLQLERLAHGEGLDAPRKATADSAGLDLRAAVREPLTIAPGERVLVPTGFAFAIPSGWEGQIRPRSGLAYKQGVTVANAPGTIDADYRGEVKVLLIHLGQEPVEVRRGDRIAQLLLAPVPEVEIEVTDRLPPSDRGAGGFGSTGSS